MQLARGVAVMVVMLLVAAAAPAPSSGADAPTPPPIRHVFVINLENQNYAETFGPDSPAPYLSRTLTSKGTLLMQYFAVGHASLDNYIAEISGQGPSRQTQRDCATFRDFVSTGTGELGQVLGDGCVYPKSVPTIADELAAKHLTWKGYLEDMATPCRHPRIGGRDRDADATTTSTYATRHNPFVYFHSIIDSPACRRRVVPLDRLGSDLASVATTPNYSMITPGLCNDAHDSTCPDGRPGGLVAANAWLRRWVPKILASPAFVRDGLLVVTFDEAEGTDTSTCCHTPDYPNVRHASTPVAGPGGGRIGAVLVSPFIAPGSTSDTPYNHFALLCSLEDLFGLEHLGYAAQPDLQCFGNDVYTKASG